MLKFVLLCLIILCIKIQNVDSLEIKGTYHTWLITLPLPIDIVKHMLPVGVSLNTPTGFGLPLGTHPIILELGRELNCGPVIFKFLQTNFMEAKFDIPFVQIENNPGIFNLKQVVYVDSVVQSVGASVTYKLNSAKATMEMTDSLYKINHENSTLQANITEDGNWGTVEDLPNFNFYEAVLRQTWFGKDIHTCGQHTYNLSDANVKPVKATLQATAGIFNDYFPLSKFIVESIHQPLGAVEAYMNFTIASPQKC